MFEIRRKFLQISVMAVLIGSAFLGVTSAAAQTKTDTDTWAPVKAGAASLNQLPSTDASAIIGQAIRGLMMFMGAIMFILVVYGGFIWMTAQGNSEKVDQARNIIVWATLGVAVMMVSYVVVNYLFSTFGLYPSSSAPVAGQTQATNDNQASDSNSPVPACNAKHEGNSICIGSTTDEACPAAFPNVDQAADCSGGQGTCCYKSAPVTTDCIANHPPGSAGCFGHNSNDSSACTGQYSEWDSASVCSGGQTCCFNPQITSGQPAPDCAASTNGGTCEHSCGKQTLAGTNCDAQGEICCYGTAQPAAPTCLVNHPNGDAKCVFASTNGQCNDPTFTLPDSNSTCSGAGNTCCTIDPNICPRSTSDAGCNTGQAKDASCGINRFCRGSTKIINGNLASYCFCSP